MPTLPAKTMEQLSTRIMDLVARTAATRRISIQAAGERVFDAMMSEYPTVMVAWLSWLKTQQS